MPELKKEQAEAVFHERGDILVSASAGSGKTYTMIERVKRLVTEKNVDVSEILAVTFTEASAADMKEKLKKALIEKIGGENDARLVGQLAAVSTADISTLHSFCGRLIRTYFFTAGVSPDFSIIDEADAKVMRRECVDRVFKEFYDSGDERFYDIVDRHASGRSDEKLKELVLKAYSFCDSEAEPEKSYDLFISNYSERGNAFILSEYKRILDGELQDLLLPLEEAIEAFEFSGLAKGKAFVETLYADIKSVLNSDDVYFVKNYENYALKVDFERKLDETLSEYKAEAVAVRDKVKKLFKKFAKHLTDRSTDNGRLEGLCAHTEEFVKILKRFGEIYSKEKRQENLLDFNDLEHYALKILSDGEIVSAVRKKYKYVFVDEYQDTNGVQEEIISRIANDNLFMVGDVKQSIYGFRGCRPEIFAKKYAHMEKNGQKVLMLNDNFRSASAVINTVNDIFRYCMTEKYFGENYAGRSELRAGGIYPEGCDGRAELHFLKKADKEKEEELPRVYDVLKEAENSEGDKTASVASLLTEIINDELTKAFYDTKEKKFKQVTYKDIAVLTRNKNGTYVSELVKGLSRHGIPVTSDVKENVCDFPEISMMVCALKAVDCFSQDIPLAATLKSPIGGFSDEDLAEIVCFYRDERSENKDVGFCDAYRYYISNAETELKNRLKDFDEYFAKIRYIADFVGAHGVLERLIKDKNIEANLFAERSGKLKVSRLRRFVSASVAGGKRYTVKEFLYKAETSPEAFGFSECGDEDTVKVMTIHASKGLEFPVVIVCGLERQMNDEEESGDVLFSREHGFAFKYYDDEKRTTYETPLRGVIREKMRKERMKEEMRLFYVATTRATYSLHLTFEGKEDKRSEKFTGAEHFLDYIPSFLPVTVHLEEDFDFTNLKAGVRKVLIGQADFFKTEKIRKNINFSYPFAADTAVPLKSNVTEAAIVYADENAFAHVLFDEPSPDTEKGLIAHKLLEYYRFGGEAFSVQVDGMVKAGILDYERLDKINLERIKRAVTGGAFDCVAGMKLYREKSFLVGIPANMLFETESTEEVAVQGIIDLLAIDGDKAVIIDYKYSSLERESLKLKYAKQLDLYAYAAEKVLKKKVVKKTLVNLFTGETVDLM